VNGLVTGLNLSPTKSNNLTDKIYYLLSIIVTHNDNYRLNEDNGGYRNICSIQIKKVLGNKDFYFILDLLLNPDNPIIETNHSWYHPKTGGKKGFCNGYRLVEKYNTGNVVFKTLSDRLSDLISGDSSEENDVDEINEDYSFLFEQFERHNLSIDPSVYKYIQSFGKELATRVDDHNPFQITLVHNLIGRWLYYLEKFESKELWYSVSSKNHRLSSSITNLPKILRQFLKCDNQLFGMLDVSSSQPYILASVMSNNFFNGINKGYNLSTIFPELYHQLNDTGYINNDTSNINNKYYSTYSGTSFKTYITTNSNNSFINNSYTGTSSFMWCSFFTPVEMTSISRYQQSPFSDDFYSHVIRTYQNSMGIVNQTDIQIERQKLKGSFMYVLFDDNNNHRTHNPNIQMVQTEYPGVDKWIREAHKVIGKTRFAHLLQRSESYLLLNVVCRELNEYYPDVPLFTIHDAILCHPNHLQVITSHLKNRLSEITGVNVGVKMKYPQIDPEPQLKDIDSEWDKIGSITTIQKYNKVSGSVFSSNVKRGSDFLKKN
jgi:hypothetical protein